MTKQNYLAQAKSIIESVKGKNLTTEERGWLAIEVAALLLKEANQDLTVDDILYEEQAAGLLQDQKAKTLLTSLSDQCFRSENPRRSADQLIFLINKFGIPQKLPWIKKLGLTLFKYLGSSFPTGWMKIINWMIRKEMYRFVIPGEENKFFSHLAKRAREHIKVNLNHLGEAILGEEEAANRLKVYLKDLERPEVEYISVKISTLYSQINLTAPDEALNILSDRLKLLYRSALENKYRDAKGNLLPKFVNLDMEEYKDFRLTVELFKRTLSEQEFLPLPAGIVLQSYLPESYLLQEELTRWSRQRLEKGGSPIKIRLVKGANLAMEQVEASLQNLNQAPYLSKQDVDANFKKMIEYGTQSQNIQAVRLGIGSHNLFDIAYALLIKSEKQLGDSIEFEMLEGMAEPLRRVVQSISGQMLLYCPVASQNELQYAIAYLVRRLDENTAPENFLRHAFKMSPGTKEWEEQKLFFLNSCSKISGLDSNPRRNQNRFLESKDHFISVFQNEPDTDWSQPQNQDWGKAILKEWSQRKIEPIPLVIGSKVILDRKQGLGIDPSFPDEIAYTYALASEQDIQTALETAAEAQKKWKRVSINDRSTLLEKAARSLRKHRKNLIGAMIKDTAKPILEGDAEVSEAIDFAEYYRRVACELCSLQDIEWNPKGIVLVAPPWNFPCSIPASGIFSALITGNSVIFKPAPEAVLVGWELVNILWEAGIPQDLLQFFTCEDEPTGSQLIKDSRISLVILTGGTSTAQKFLKMRPGIDLTAETGGKNGIIATAMADRDLAVKNIIASAFGYAGQKCSACSLLICEKEVYRDPHFRKTLKDAAKSLKVGSAWDPSVKINPLIRPPSPVLERGLTQLDDGEEWLLEPRQDSLNPLLWTPGIKLGVKAESFIHQNELFGPVLGIMEAENLNHAIELANGTPYGLTAGLQSLDEREQEKWSHQIQAGNCYVNRGITGAIVQRQPFGGCKKSHFGRGFKAGGPNYIIQMMNPRQISLPDEGMQLEDRAKDFYTKNLTAISRQQLEIWRKSLESYIFYWKHYFSLDHDSSKVLGQDNILRYLPKAKQILRLQKQEETFDALRASAAALICGAELEVSSPFALENVNLKMETENQFLARISKEARIRFFSEPSPEMKSKLAELECLFFVEPVLANGRLELLNYLSERSLSIDYHRYGYLGMHNHYVD